MLTGNWWAFAAPRDTDPRIVERLANEVRQVLSEPAVKQRFIELGMVAGGESPSEFRQILQLEAVRWKKIIENSGVKAE